MLTTAGRAWVAALNADNAMMLLDSGNLQLSWAELATSYPTHAQPLQHALIANFAALEGQEWKTYTVSIDSFKLTRTAPGAYRLYVSASYRGPEVLVGEYRGPGHSANGSEIATLSNALAGR